ncbi:MAG TPA: hypothetical protein VGJ22_03430, partial [Anaerolineales bacterium]
PLLAAWIWGAAERPVYGFGVSLATALIFLVLTIRKPRALPWTSSLVSAIVAFFTLPELPIFAGHSLWLEYLIAIAAFLLLLPDTFLSADFNANQTLRWPPRILGAALFLSTLLAVLSESFSSAGHRAVVLSAFAILALVDSFRYRKPWITYAFTGLTALAAVDSLRQFHSQLWLPVLIGLAVAYYAAGTASGGVLTAPLRYSGLALGGLTATSALFDSAQRGVGWYCLIVAALYLIEEYRHKNSWMEAGTFLFASAATWDLLRIGVRSELSYRLVGLAVLWMALDLAIAKTYHEIRRLKGAIAAGSVTICVLTAVVLLTRGTDAPRVAFAGFAVFSIAFLINALLRKSPLLGYAASSSFALSIFYLTRDTGGSAWLFALIAIAIAYYAAGFVLRRREMRLAGAAAVAALRTDSWSSMLIVSGLGLASLLSLAAPGQGRLDAVIPVALAASLWAVEAFARRNVWLGFPANGLYLLAYFMILSTLNVDEPQFYSLGAAALGLLMHYLLTRSGSRTGAFLTGMLSQLVLLSTTYIQMVSTQHLSFFVVLFFQALAVLIYGIVIRSRSLVATPIAFIVLGVITVVYSALKGISTVILIGCTGITLLLLGILAVVLRERLLRISERFSDWKA